jgi:hypothetical protein
MPRFLRRIFADSPFRKEHSGTDDLTTSRRVLVKSSGGALEGFTRRLSFFDLVAQTEGGGSATIRDGASVGGSSAHRPILAPSVADHEGPSSPPKVIRARRRLSKKHRKPT